MSDGLGDDLEDPPLDAGERIGRWQLVRHVGSGGMACVYEAVHSDLGRRVALKVLHRRLFLDREMRTRFVREGRAASLLSHPHLVPVHDAGIDGERAFLVMELLRGETLADQLARQGRLSAAECAQQMLPIVSALAAVHLAGIIHRDIKPSNIFLERDGDTLRPRLLDFGTSRFVDGTNDDPALTRTRSLLGTPAYMSPEQADGARNISPRSDQFSLGSVLYECVTGRRAFDESNWQRTLVAVLRARPTPPRKVLSEIPAALERVILRAMAIAPAERFASMRALGSALAEATGKAAVARWQALSRGLPPETETVREPRVIPRRRIAWLALASAGVLGVTMLGVAVASVRPHATDRLAAMPSAAWRSPEPSTTTSVEPHMPAGVAHPQLPMNAPAPAAIVSPSSAQRTRVHRSLSAPVALAAAATGAVRQETEATPPDIAVETSQSSAAPSLRVLGRGANHALILAH